MKKLFFCIIYFMALPLNDYSLLKAQTDPKNLPFVVNIKKNINNIKTINLSSIGKDVQYIPLETTPKSLISEIFSIEFSESYIFINDTKKRLLQFDNNGKFIRQIGSNGRGPGEYLSVGDFCINENKKEIYIISPNLLIFDFDGLLKNSVKLSVRPAQIILKDQENLMYHMWNVTGKIIPYEFSWIITNSQGILLRSFKNYHLRSSVPGLIVGYTPFYKYDNVIHFMEFGVDTLYYFNGNQKLPYAIFNFENLKMDTDPLITSSNIKDLGEKLFNRIWFKNIKENNDFLFMEFFHGLTDSTTYALFNKKTFNLTFLKESGLNNDLTGGKPFWPRKILNNNVLVDYIDAFKLLKNINEIQLEAKTKTKTKKGKTVPTSLLNISKGLTETSNPVLMILR